MTEALKSHLDKSIFIQKNRNQLQPDHVFNRLQIDTAESGYGDNQKLLDQIIIETVS
jgi:hypothetical protein